MQKTFDCGCLFWTDRGVAHLKPCRYECPVIAAVNSYILQDHPGAPIFDCRAAEDELGRNLTTEDAMKLLAQVTKESI